MTNDGLVPGPIGGPGGEWPTWPPEVPPREPIRPVEPPPPRTSPGPMLPFIEERSGDRDVEDRLLEQRVVIVSGRLDHALATHAASRLLLLGRSDRPIDLHLVVPSSDLEAALTLADTVDVVRAPVHAVVGGVLTGPAVAVLCAAAERTAHPHALIVLSLPPADRADGTASELATRAEQRTRQIQSLNDRICSVTGRGQEEVDADLRTGRVLSAPEAQQYGLLTSLP